MSTIGERIKQVRKLKGLTQTGLAKRVGVVPSTISTYESNKRNPNINVLRSIAISTRTSLDFLLEDTDMEKGFVYNKPIKVTKQVTKPVELEKSVAKTSEQPSEFYKFVKQLHEYHKGGKEYLESQFNIIRKLHRFSDEATARKCKDETERYNNMIEALWAKKFAQRLQKELQ